MERTQIKDISSQVGNEVKIAGFVHAIRDQGSIKFLMLRDITGIIQVVVLKSEKEVFNLVSELSLESVIEINGLAKEEKQASSGFEIEAKEIKVLSAAQPGLPIPVVEKGGDETDISKRLDWRVIDLRKQENQKIFKVWTQIEKGFRNYFEENDYIQVYPPALMSTASESGAEVFEVGYFEKKAFLAQSPQFYKQMAMASGFEKVFMVGPVFRAEQSFTTRHMTEFTGWDFEISYIESHHDVMKSVEEAFVSGLKALDLKALDLDFKIPELPFPKITMADAKVKLKEAGIKSDKAYDVSPEEERKLCELIKEETGSDFVFLIDYPIEARPFYHMRYEDNPKLTKSFDLLYKGIELVTGSQREHRYDVLLAQAKDKKMDIKSLEGYFDFFKYGCPPHGGAGIGPARLIMKLLDLPSVKEATFLPRDVKRLTP